MIALERPAALAPPQFEPDDVPERVAKRQHNRSRRLRAWAVQVPSGGSGVAILLTLALLAATAGGGGPPEGRIAGDLQGPAAAGFLHTVATGGPGASGSAL